MKNKVILKMNKYILVVTYFLRVSISGEPSEPLPNIGLLILPILKEKQETLTSVSILVYTIRVIIGIHYIHLQN